MQHAFVVKSLLVYSLLAAPPAMRRESAPEFEIDDAFQDKGGVQYFYEFETTSARPKADSMWAHFRTLDDAAKPTDTYEAVMSHLVYTVERDASWFTEARARSIDYLRAVAPEMKITAQPDGSFLVGRAPQNRFRLTWYATPRASDPTLAPFYAFLPKGAEPVSIVVQHNTDFARVMGMRTAERSITYTAHFAIAPGRTRIVVCTVSLLHNVPPFFLGGKNRVYREAVAETAQLIEALREYKGD